MKTASFIVLVLIVMSSCKSSKYIPLPPLPGDNYSYYDSSYVRLNQHEQYVNAAKDFDRLQLNKPTVVTIGLTAFGIYCILAWRYDIE